MHALDLFYQSGRDCADANMYKQIIMQASGKDCEEAKPMQTTSQEHRNVVE